MTTGSVDNNIERGRGRYKKPYTPCWFCIENKVKNYHFTGIIIGAGSPVNSRVCEILFLLRWLYIYTYTIKPGG